MNATILFVLLHDVPLNFEGSPASRRDVVKHCCDVIRSGFSDIQSSQALDEKSARELEMWCASKSKRQSESVLVWLALCDWQAVHAEIVREAT